jgi:hypothetical protein
MSIKTLARLLLVDSAIKIVFKLILLFCTNIFGNSVSEERKPQRMWKMEVTSTVYKNTLEIFLANGISRDWMIMCWCRSKVRGIIFRHLVAWQVGVRSPKLFFVRSGRSVPTTPLL